MLTKGDLTWGSSGVSVDRWSPDCRPLPARSVLQQRGALNAVTAEETVLVWLCSRCQCEGTGGGNQRVCSWSVSLTAAGTQASSGGPWEAR